MLPVFYRFTFNTPSEQLFFWLLGLALVIYAAWSGYKNATSLDAKGQPIADALPADRRNRAITYAFVGVGIVLVGASYALNGLGSWASALPIMGGGKGEGIPIHTYGVLVGAGFISAVTASAWMASKEWPGKLGLIRRDQVLDMAFYLFIGGIVGSRVLFMIVNIKDYLANPASMLSLGGGLVFQGGLAGAAMVGYWYCKKHGIEFMRLLDFGLPTVSLGSAFGRLGCFSAGCCWGRAREAGATLAVHFPGTGLVKNIFGQTGDTASLAYQSMADGANETRWYLEATGEVFQQAVPGAVRLSEWVQQHHHTIPIHPTQLYESVAQTLLFALFVYLRRFRRFHGQIAGIWLMVYAIERTTVETFRGDSERGTLAGALKSVATIDPHAWYNISTSQLGSLFIFAAGAALLYRQYSQWKQQPSFLTAAA